jgi:hypothetical protein
VILILRSGWKHTELFKSLLEAILADNIIFQSLGFGDLQFQSLVPAISFNSAASNEVVLGTVKLEVDLVASGLLQVLNCVLKSSLD